MENKIYNFHLGTMDIAWKTILLYMANDKINCPNDFNEAIANLIYASLSAYITLDLDDTESIINKLMDINSKYLTELKAI